MITTNDKKIGYIFSNFTRSFDDYHLDNSRIHLVSSVLYDEDKDGLFSERVFNYTECFKNSWESEDSYLFIVTLNRIQKDVTVKRSGNLIVAIISLDDLIGHLNFTTKSHELFEDIFGG